MATVECIKGFNKQLPSTRAHLLVMKLFFEKQCWENLRNDDDVMHFRSIGIKLRASNSRCDRKILTPFVSRYSDKMRTFN